MEASAIRAIFFDMDGVLYDSMPNHEYTWINSLKEFGIDFQPEEAYMNEGRTGYSTIRIAFQKYLNRQPTKEEEEAAYQLKTALMNKRPAATIFPHMQELIHQLKNCGIKIFVVTGSRQPALVSKLNTDFAIDAACIISGADVEQGKPHPEPYLKAWERSGYNKNECIVVENAPMGVESAKAAGLYTIAINTGKLNDQVLLEAGADELYADSKQLSEALKKIGHEKR